MAPICFRHGSHETRGLTTADQAGAKLKPSSGLGRRKYGVGVAIDLHMAPDPRNAAVSADQYRCPDNAEKGLAIHRLLAPSAIGLEHLVFFIRDKRNR